MSHAPTKADERKALPVASGVLDYFPDALLAIAEVSRAGNEQHNPGKPLHWDRSKSGDEADALVRHFLDRGTRDSDGLRHSAKVAWRALALLQKEIEAETEPVNLEPGAKWFADPSDVLFRDEVLTACKRNREAYERERERRDACYNAVLGIGPVVTCTCRWSDQPNRWWVHDLDCPTFKKAGR